MTLTGGGAAVEVEAGALYLAASLRNVGEGIAVLQGWRTAVARHWYLDADAPR